MFSENGILIDFDEIKTLVATADVFALAFANFPERLLVDTRSNEKELPLVRVVQPAGSAQERIAWIYRRRPSLGRPERFSLVGWPHSPSLLIASGVWDRIQRQVGANEDQQVESQCSLALKELEELDREAIYALLKGENCVTLWPPPAEED